MIKHITGTNGVKVNGYVEQPYISPGAQSAGMVRYNTNMNQLEAYDGIAWKSLSGNFEIELSPDVWSVVNWAKQKMEEEKRLDGLCEKYPGLRNARDNYETFKRLVESGESV